MSRELTPIPRVDPNTKTPTDARQAYVDLPKGSANRVFALDAAHLTIGGKSIFKNPKRGDVEKW